MSGSCRETFPNVREWSGIYSRCPGGPTGCPVVVGWPFRMSGSGREASRMSGSGREALPDVLEWSGGPPGCPGVIGKPSRMSGNGREVLPDDREWSGGFPDVRE